MNREAIRHHLDSYGYTYNETDDGFEILDPVLRASALVEMGACEASIEHQEVGFRVFENR